jgi:hypothetical protein
MITIDNKFDIGQTVYLKTDKEQEARIVFAFKVTKCEITYQLAFGAATSEHYDFEISEEKDVLIATS